jgi:Rrf2 family protein
MPKLSKIRARAGHWVTISPTVMSRVSEGTRGSLFGVEEFILDVCNSNTYILDIKVQFSENESRMISQGAEYALRAVICLAQQPGRSLTTQQVAEATHVPVGYLAKLLQLLARARIVTSQRGLNGGFVLARLPASLTLLDIVRVVDSSHRIDTCPLKIACHGTNLCALHRRLDEAAATIERLLGSATVSEILRDTASPCPLCNHLPAALTPPSGVRLD